MKNQNSISLLTRKFYIQRNKQNTPFAGLTWEDTEFLFSSIILDMVNNLSGLNNTDIILFVNNTDLKKEYLDKITEKAEIVEIPETNENNKLKYAMNYVVDAGYMRNVFLFNYFPIFDLSYYENVFLWLSDEQEYIFIAPLKDMTLGMLAMRGLNKGLLNDFSDDIILNVEDTINKFIKDDIYLVNTGTLPSLIDLNDLLYLKQKIDDLLKNKSFVPKYTHETLKQFTKKYTSNTKSHETRDIRRYF